MIHLIDLIHTLNKNEITGFKGFVQRRKKMFYRKDLDLFDLIDKNQNNSSFNYTKALYGADNPENRNAYHTIRKRLFKQLIDYLLVITRENEDVEEYQIQALVNLSKYLFDHDLPLMAKKFLLKAELTALKNRNHSQCKHICFTKIEYRVYYSDVLKQTIKEYENHKVLADEDQRAVIANAIINSQLEEIIMQGKSFDLDHLVKKVLGIYQLENAIQRPKILRGTLRMLRTATLVGKNFKDFAPYAIKSYEACFVKPSGDKFTHRIELDILYMISHALYRDRKFHHCNQYLRKIEEELNRFQGKYIQAWKPKFILLQASVYNYTGQLDQAIDLLDYFVASNNPMTLEDALDMKLNLVFYFFNKEDYKQANKLMFRYFNQTNHWYAVKKGKDWVLRKMLLELFVHIELENIDLIESLIRSIERFVESLIHLPSFQKTKLFVTYVKKYLEQPNIMEKSSFLKQALVDLRKVPALEFGVTTLAFVSWYKAKALNKPYYQVMLESVKTLEEPFL